MSHLSELTDLFRQSSDLGVGDAAWVFMGHVVNQRIHLPGEVPETQHNTIYAHSTWTHKHLCTQVLFQHFKLEVHQEQQMFVLQEVKPSGDHLNLTSSADLINKQAAAASAACLLTNQQ